MGEAKRRKELGQNQPSKSIRSWWSKEKAQQFVDITTRGAWIGIGVMVVYWLVVRFVGPYFGWWQLHD
ncbi:MAG: DUF2839 domain-containing protein [Pseudanabaenaceae cyanobacterium]